MNFYKYAVISTILFSAFGANAQDSYFQDELNNLREDVRILQRQVYRGVKSGDIKPEEQNSSTSPSAVNIQAMGEYDKIIRDLNGKIDELEHKISKLEEKMNKMDRDYDVRMRLIEGKKINGIGTNAEAAKKHDAPIANNAPKFVTGAAVKGESLPPIRTSDASVKEIYDTGLDALNSGDIEIAIQNFSTITQQYPNDKLASNAYYWLGEAYYKQQDYKNAAISFANGYQQYKDTLKAPDNLFKLGMSMKGLNKTDEACSAFLNLEKEFPSAEFNLRRRAKEEAHKLGCKQ